MQEPHKSCPGKILQYRLVVPGYLPTTPFSLHTVCLCEDSTGLTAVNANLKKHIVNFTMQINQLMKARLQPKNLTIDLLFFVLFPSFTWKVVTKVQLNINSSTNHFKESKIDDSH